MRAPPVGISGIGSSARIWNSSVMLSRLIRFMLDAQLQYRCLGLTLSSSASMFDVSESTDSVEYPLKTADFILSPICVYVWTCERPYCMYPYEVARRPQRACELLDLTRVRLASPYVVRSSDGGGGGGGCGCEARTVRGSGNTTAARRVHSPSSCSLSWLWVAAGIDLFYHVVIAYTLCQCSPIGRCMFDGYMTTSGGSCFEVVEYAQESRFYVYITRN